MEASGSVESIAKYMTEKLGTQRAILAIVLAGAFVTYGGVSLFVAFFARTDGTCVGRAPGSIG